MTQKELLYVEDAIQHEMSILKIIKDMKNQLDDKNLLSFMDEQVISHEKIQNELIGLLKENAHE